MSSNKESTEQIRYQEYQVSVANEYVTDELINETRDKFPNIVTTKAIDEFKSHAIISNQLYQRNAFHLRDIIFDAKFDGDNLNTMSWMHVRGLITRLAYFESTFLLDDVYFLVDAYIQDDPITMHTFFAIVDLCR